MYLLILQFRAERYQELVQDLDGLSDWMNSVDGLLSKTWLQDAKSQRIGGIYHFSSWQQLLAYKDSDALAEFKKQYAVTDYQESCFETAEVDTASGNNRSPFFS